MGDNHAAMDKEGQLAGARQHVGNSSSSSSPTLPEHMMAFSQAAPSGYEKKSPAPMHVHRSAGGPSIAVYILIWYAASGGVILVNKHLLSEKGVTPHELSLWQLASTVVYGASGLAATGQFTRAPPAKYLGGLGALRIVTLCCNYLALAHCAASFVETVKSSAPALTVAFASVILREFPTQAVLCSIVIITCGLLMACGTEISFDHVGLVAVVVTTVLECFQNICSKYALRDPAVSATSLQFYTSVAAAGIQLPLLLKDERRYDAFWPLLLDGLLFHCQSLTAYFIMDKLGSTSVSVLNSVKRLVIVMLSIWWFQKPYTAGSMVGSLIVLAGALFYNLATRSPLQVAKTIKAA
jgi:solute carrier family 35 protein E2